MIVVEPANELAGDWLCDGGSDTMFGKQTTAVGGKPDAILVGELVI